MSQQNLMVIDNIIISILDFLTNMGHQIFFGPNGSRPLFVKTT